MTKVEKLKEEINSIEIKIIELNKLRDIQLKLLFKTCKHPKDQVVEGDVLRFTYIGSIHPPFRVCKQCGYAETGWGCGYYKLNWPRSKILTIQRDVAERFVRRKVSQDEMWKMKHKKLRKKN